MIEARNISVRYGDTAILHDISLTISAHEITTLIGANGCGKSTLLKALSGLHPVKTGEVLLSGHPLSDWSRKEIARQIAVLSQSPQAPEGLSVAQLVEHGQFSQKSLFSRGNLADVHWALEQTGMEDHADRPFDDLSGGEKQRVWISLALIQKPQMLLLDEPTSYLDLGHQIDLLNLLIRLQKDQGIGILMVLHDINQASFYADRLIALKDGHVYADAAPHDVISSELVKSLLNADVTVMQDQSGNHPYCVPFGRI
ncbi:iron complex transport system ATP-binding protein [Aliiroseovarius halocynthiae]|uniref:ABC transporter ATP-binding protein n=1 Tax=Aliiroseovarius halocynthiae TaxID=985055 RepID=A0A545SLA7_9RHOB|nr:ABC transporter ATP-binding protein [Aliiroseovarius halocynthiae]TQV65770.1 ABC transporter ATP-binding protein [Aliiroseovarius halocynthiae]SMR83536.1 iron complex transport system ATP-binding protein [Aliiroseovarius halocynthiae]